MGSLPGCLFAVYAQCRAQFSRFFWRVVRGRVSKGTKRGVSGGEIRPRTKWLTEQV